MATSFALVILQIDTLHQCDTERCACQEPDEPKRRLVCLLMASSTLVQNSFQLHDGRRRSAILDVRPLFLFRPVLASTSSRNRTIICAGVGTIAGGRIHFGFGTIKPLGPGVDEWRTPGRFRSIGTPKSDPGCSEIEGQSYLTGH